MYVIISTRGARITPSRFSKVTVIYFYFLPFSRVNSYSSFLHFISTSLIFKFADHRFGCNAKQRITLNRIVMNYYGKEHDALTGCSIHYNSSVSDTGRTILLSKLVIFPWCVYCIITIDYIRLLLNIFISCFRYIFHFDQKLFLFIYLF